MYLAQFDWVELHTKVVVAIHMSSSFFNIVLGKFYIQKNLSLWNFGCKEVIRKK